MKHSDSLDKLAPALVAFQHEVGNPGKDANNPAFRNVRYTTLDYLLQHIRDAMHRNGLSHFQSTETRDDGRTGCRTMILHTSGQFIEGDMLYLKDARKDDAQGAGSCITYARRYSLLAALGLAPSDDDDGHGASHVPPSGVNPDRIVQTTPVPQDADMIHAIETTQTMDDLRALHAQMDGPTQARLKDHMAKRKKELAS